MHSDTMTTNETNQPAVAAENEHQPVQADAIETPAANTQPEAPKKGHKKLIATIVVIVLLLIGGGAYAFFVHSQNDEEEMAYEILENNDNPADYEDFLAKYPNSEHADEVRDRLAKIEAMIQAWQGIALSDNVNDFRNFKNTYPDEKYGRLCDIKIDSLDWVTAQRIGTAEAYQAYLDQHSDGRYASEASIAQGKIHDSEVTASDRDQVMRVVTDFFNGFEQQNESQITSNITSTMTTFLHTHNASKAEVVNEIKGMFNEHIQGCQFVVNRDIDVQRQSGADPSTANFNVTFTVDQHIQRDNEGKTFGTYKCVAVLTPQFLISSLTLTETSANR